MNHDVIVTGAVTGAGYTGGKHPAIPVSPKQIADAAIDVDTPEDLALVRARLSGSRCCGRSP